MKKTAGLLILSLFLGMVGFQVVEAKKKEVFVLCRHIVSPQVLERIVVKKKKLKNGVLIVMKSNDEKKLLWLRGIIEKSLQEAAALTDDSKYPFELLYRKGVACTVTGVKNGFQLQMISNDPGLVKIIKKVFLPVQRRQVDVTSEIEGNM